MRGMRISTLGTCAFSRYGTVTAADVSRVCGSELDFQTELLEVWPCMGMYGYDL
jgi:hypothetical protein